MMTSQIAHVVAEALWGSIKKTNKIVNIRMVQIWMASTVTITEEVDLTTTNNKMETLKEA